ncbi:CHRD domain-containing protein [Hymenobacter nivis]|uniref:CHRD domain-containing protein n=1 Tax=Hymenobacter nivis TaxID=1850093 RepID=A0A2Z3GHB9_9BACT|nr:CHRD domain-containing protein [Hymenobacter nivis]AWM32388.1 CHRD domain-containing protein [Hymenobacter nivis]
MKNLLASLLLLAGLMTATACKKETTNIAPVQPTLGTFSGSQQVPVVTSAATGTITGTYDKTAMVLTYTVTFTGLTPIGAHLHMGAPGANGGIFYVFPFNNATGDGFVSPITGTKQLTMDQNTALLNHGVYANLHTMTYKGGEIRADMTVN